MQSSLQRASRNARPHIHGRRSEDRIHVLLNALLVVDRERFAVRINDLSSRGAMICTEHGMERGDEVTLSVGSLQVVATVAWVGAPYYGLTFHRPVAVARPEPRCIDERPSGRADLSSAYGTSGARRYQSASSPKGKEAISAGRLDRGLRPWPLGSWRQG